MEPLQLKIDGVYDLRTAKYLLEEDIRHIGVDFRPLSRNFLQQYRFFEIFENVSTHEGNDNLILKNNLNYFLSVMYYLENEDPVIK